MRKAARVVEQVLGADLAAGERPQIVVPANCWQTARSLGEWTLVGCTVAPGFDFAAFELAEPGWEPEAPSTARMKPSVISSCAA